MLKRWTRAMTQRDRSATRCHIEKRDNAFEGQIANGHTSAEEATTWDWEYRKRQERRSRKKPTDEMKHVEVPRMSRWR